MRVLLVLACLALAVGAHAFHNNDLPDDGTMNPNAGGGAGGQGQGAAAEAGGDSGITPIKIDDFLIYREYPNSQTARTLAIRHDQMTVCEDVFGTAAAAFVETDSQLRANSIDDGNTMSKECYKRPLKKLSIVDPFKITFEPEAVYPETDQTKRRFEVAVQNPHKCVMNNGMICVHGVKEYLFMTPYFFKQTQLGGLNSRDPRFPRCAAKRNWEQKCADQLTKISGF